MARPYRSYSKLLLALAQVWKIAPVDEQPFMHLGSPEGEALPQKGVRVGIWNICKGAGGRHFEHDYRILCHQTHLVLLQEALLSERAMRAFVEPGLELLHAASYRRRDGLRDGVMTAARVPMSSVPQRVVCKYSEPVLKTPKVALVTTYPVLNSQQTLMVINLHATLLRSVRRAQEEIFHLLSQLPAHRGPVLLAGDFNTFTRGYLHRIVNQLRRLGLEWVPIPDDPRSRFGLLDQVFVKGLTVTRLEVDQTKASSDHYPLVLEFDIESSA